MYINLAKIPENSIKKHKDRPVITFENKRINYKDLGGAVNVAASF